MLGSDGTARYGDIAMTALILIVVLVGLMVAFDLLALAFGVDSRDAIGDDHARPLSS
jgi:hypothetical protein